MLTIGEKIKYFRKKRGITQAQLADLSGIHPVSIRKYETNKMQPQTAQIERIAAALGVNAGAIDGMNAANIRLDSQGDLMGLLISWHKSGILCLEGQRDEANKIIESTAHFSVNPILSPFIRLTWSEGENKKALYLDDLCLELSSRSMLETLLRWEYIYNGYVTMSEKYKDTDSEANQNALAELASDLELIEMEMQASQILLR